MPCRTAAGSPFGPSFLGPSLFGASLMPHRHRASFVLAPSGAVAALCQLDQAACRGIMMMPEAGAGQLLKDRLGELFAEFDPPLVEGVDPPDTALDENLVFVQGEQHAQVMWIQTRQQQGDRKKPQLK